MTRLDEVCARYGLGPLQQEALARLLALVRDDPTAPTSVRDPAMAVDVHVADSLAGLEVSGVRDASSLADLGSGAGFPGLPLAVALPECSVALVESVGRKCTFLSRAAVETGCANVSVACARAEEWPGRDVDVVCARAVAPLAVLFEYAAPLLRLGGAVVAWKGHRDRDEEHAGRVAARHLGLSLAEVRAVEPFPAAEARTLYVYLKEHETPSRFPRRAGMARKRPLAP